MNDLNRKLPFYLKFTSLVFLVVLIFFVLYVGREIIMPFLLSMLFAILLRPMVVFLNMRLRLPHVIAVFISLLIFISFISSIIYFISWQISDFMDDWPKIKQNFNLHYANVRNWLKERLNISYSRQNSLYEIAKESSLKNPGSLVSGTILSFSHIVFTVIVIPVYTFLILIYRNLFKKFLLRVCHSKDETAVLEIIKEIKVVMQSYIVGLLIEMGIVATLTSIGLSIIGIEYPILLGVITALLNLIPYIGILIAGLISILAALINSTEISIALGVIVVNSIVQFLDNNIIVPKIVGSKVKINALVSIVGVFIGNAIAGIIGMFLAIPVIAILKVIFDRIEPLKPWGLLMGDDVSKTRKWGKIKFTDYHVGNEDPTKEK